MQKLIEKHLYQRSIFSYFFLPLSGVNYMLQNLRRKFPRKQYRAKCRIISVGNIVSGGTGKTPLTIYLARKLQEKGYSVAVSHRGYKGKFENNCTLISSEKEIFNFAKDAGDEAYLIATKLPGIPVIAGKNRTEAIKQIEKKYPEIAYVILDDSFQHLKVAHDYDLIVFNAVGGIGNGYLLPAGILREPLSALKYANHLIYNGEGDFPQNLKNTGLLISKAKYIVSDFVDQSEIPISINQLRKSKIALMSAIGMPKSFENSINEQQIKWEEHFIFSDHYDYKQKNKLIEIEEKEYDYILITEKDWAKLKFRKHNLHLIVVQVELELENFDIKALNPKP